MHKIIKVCECILNDEKAARPCHNRLKSEFQMSDVIEFQQGYAAISNKELYLGEYSKTKDKPSIIDQIEGEVVKFLVTNNLGFEVKEKEKATKALAVSVRLFHFVNADRKALSYNDSSKIK